jgi:hypothetical protein
MYSGSGSGVGGGHDWDVGDGEERFQLEAARRRRQWRQSWRRRAEPMRTAMMMKGMPTWSLVGSSGFGFGGGKGVAGAGAENGVVGVAGGWVRSVGTAGCVGEAMMSGVVIVAPRVRCECVAVGVVVGVGIAEAAMTRREDCASLCCGTGTL